MHARTLLLSLALALGADARPLNYEPSPIDPLLPRGFEILPEASIARLRAYHFDRRLTPDARRDRIEAVFDELPAATLEQLPLAPGLARLPAVFQAPFRALQVNRNISWRERMSQTHALIALLPGELQRVVEPSAPAASPPSAASSLPSRPPAGFETALSPSVYAQLVRVHADPALSDEEKKTRLNAIMRLAPREQLERLPLPPGFERLPFETVQRARALLHDFSLEWDARGVALQRFLAELPAEQQRALAAPPPPPFTAEQLPSPQREALRETLADESLDAPERLRKVEALLDTLPADVRARVPPPPAVPSWASRS